MFILRQFTLSVASRKNGMAGYADFSFVLRRAMPNTAPHPSTAIPCPSRPCLTCLPVCTGSGPRRVPWPPSVRARCVARGAMGWHCRRAGRTSLPPPLNRTTSQPDALPSCLRRIRPSSSSMASQRARALRGKGGDVLALTAGEPDFDTPQHIQEAARRAMASGQTRYTDVGGTPELKEAIAGKFRAENGLHFSPDEIIVGAGAKQVIFNALMCTVRAGDEVIVPAPYWVSYPDIVWLAGGMPVHVDCPASLGFKLQPEALEQAITARTRWLILNSPNNPSGAAYLFAELQALAEVLKRHP